MSVHVCACLSVCVSLCSHVMELNISLAAGKTLLMILKWGGEITPDGEKQAEEFGTAFRCIYPDGEGEYGSLPGSGFLRLHSTYRHDLKVYASDEGRVQTTAAAFTKVCMLICGRFEWLSILNFI